MTAISAFIDSPDDPRVAVFREVRDRDVAGRHGGFIAEGEVVLRSLAKSPTHRARSILVGEKRVGRLASLLEAFAEPPPVFAASQAVMDAIVGFPIHRGLLAHGERGEPASADQLLAQIAGPAVIVVLVGVANHDNVGAAFRNAAAFGARAVLLDSTCCDPLYRKAIRVSVGAALLVPFARVASCDEITPLLMRHGFEPLALSPSGATNLVDVRVAPRTAVLVGEEGRGLPPQILAGGRSVAIPMMMGFDSLNLATATGIVLNRFAELRAAGAGEG